MSQDRTVSNLGLFAALSPLVNEIVLAGEGDWSPEEEWQRYKQRQEVLADVFTGRRDPDEFLELIEKHSINPDDYLEETEEALDLYF